MILATGMGEAARNKTNGFQVILELSEDFVKSQELAEHYISYPGPLAKRENRLKVTRKIITIY